MSSLETVASPFTGEETIISRKGERERTCPARRRPQWLILRRRLNCSDGSSGDKSLGSCRLSLSLSLSR